MNGKVLLRMMWKDARTLRTLAIATPVMTVVFYFLLILFAGMSGYRTERMSVAYAIWFMLPMLIAYGAPAVLVGGEEESGSLAWLKTLPASWRSITASQLTVTTFCLAFSWLVGTICFLAYWTSMSETVIQRARAEGGIPEPFWIHLAWVVAFSLALMLSSFLTAYLFRSPITGLLAVIPVMIVVLGILANIAGAIIPPEQLRGPSAVVTENVFGVFSFLSLIGLAFLLSATLLAAWRRLTWPESRRRFRFAASAAAAAYRPPSNEISMRSIPSIIKGRPTPWRALLWLELAPIRWYIILLLLIAFFGGAITLLSGQGSTVVGNMLCGISLSMIASFTFYSDSVRKRRVFLYDRGISPAKVWWTRVGTMFVLAMLAVMPAIVAFVFHDWLLSEGQASLRLDWITLSIVTIVIGVFSLTQLVSQWTPRPALAFFTGPVLVTMTTMVHAALFFTYPRAIPVLFLSSAILLFASWRLTPKWMSGETTRGYVGAFIGYILLAAVLPYFLVLGHRSITTPKQRVTWRQEMMSMELPKPDEDAARVSILDPAFVRRLESMATSPAVDTEGRFERMQQEWEATDSVGKHSSFKEILKVVSPAYDYQLEYHQDFAQNNLSTYLTPHVYPATQEYESARKTQFDAIRILLKWSTMTRKQAVQGKANFNVVIGVAEHADLVALHALMAYANAEGLTDELEELVELMPTRELVLQSRRYSLIRSWRSYQDNQFNRRFAGCYVAQPNAWWLGVERKRSDRYIDELCVLTLDQWESGQNFQSPESIEQLKRFAHEAYLTDPMPISAHYNQPLVERLNVLIESDRLRKELSRRVQSAGD